jgi:hypothetical protein
LTEIIIAGSGHDWPWRERSPCGHGQEGPSDTGRSGAEARLPQEDEGRPQAEKNGDKKSLTTNLIVFDDFRQAARNGFYTKTHWRKENRRPCVEGFAIVVTKTGKEMLPTSRPVLEVVSAQVVVVAMDFFDVFSLEETEELSSVGRNGRVGEGEEENAVLKTPDADTSSTSSCKNYLPPSPPPLPYDVRNDTSSSPTRSSVNLPKGVVFDENQYLPEGLTLEGLPPQVKAGVGYLVHLVYHRRVMERLAVDEFIPLKAQYLRSIIPCWKQVKETALGLGIVECDGHYVEGQKSYGFRLKSPDLRRTTHRLRPIENVAIRRKLKRRNRLKLPVHKWLFGKLREVEMDEPADDELLRIAEGDAAKAKTYGQAVEAIRNGEWWMELAPKTGRLFSNITNLKRELRGHLRVKGEPLVEMDIRNSQPTFLALLCLRHGIHADRYRQVCEEGRLYEHLGGITGLSREETKTQLIKQAFFSKNGYSNATKRAFRGEFPEVAEFIRRIKEKDHARLAVELQRAEANFVIRTACERMMKERPEMFVSTIHDCLMTLPGDADYARAVMTEEFARLGLKLSVEVKVLMLEGPQGPVPGA